MKAAIVCLTRGYGNVLQYETLIKRNHKLFNNFNKRYDYPLIIFHEGNISPIHQNYIEKNSCDQKLIFVDIQDEFTWPEEIKQIRDNRFNLGYRMMCRFHSYFIWEHLKEYDYVLRVDEDGFIKKLDYNIFEHMIEKNLDYMTCRFMEEYHSLTNDTLPQACEKLLDNWTVKDYNQNEKFWIPYTNLYTVKVSFFMQEKVQSFLKSLTMDPNFLMNRWGDAPVHGITLKAFGAKTNFIEDCIYEHGSHKCTVENGRALNGYLSEKEGKYFNLIPDGKSEIIEFDGQKLYNYGTV